jgi:hypothetical protein
LLLSCQVGLISHQNNISTEILGVVLNEIGDLLLDRLETLVRSYVVNSDAGLRISVVALGDGPEPLLACCVPYLHADNSVVNLQSLNFEIYPDGTLVALVKLVVYVPS